jgi:DNA-binding transcriptional LysR family regulator
MQIRHIRYFLALCEEKHFTRAARRCGISQPSLSNAIKKLERDLNGPLFHRDRFRLRLTALGEKMWPRMQRIDFEFRQIQHSAREFHAPNEFRSGRQPSAA